MIALPVAVGIAVTGNAAVLVAAAETGGNDLGLWVQGGGSAAAVAGLVYVARMIIKGDLVPRAVAERENEQAAQNRIAAENERKLMALNERSLRREEILADTCNGVVQHVADMTAAQRVNTEELRWWRDQRERSQGKS